LINQNHTKRGLKKPRAAQFNFRWRQPRNFENVTLVARQREHFWGFLADFFEREIMLFIGKPKGRSMMISNFFDAELPSKRGVF